MALSNSFDYTLDKSQVIAEALENIGISDPSAEDTGKAGRSLQLLLKSIINNGLHMWTWREASLPLTVGAQSYVLGTGGTAVDALTSAVIVNPVDINDVRLYGTDGTESPCTIISLSEYKAYNNKSDTGEIINVAFQIGINAATLYVYPVNTDTTQTLRFQYKRPLDDVDNSEDSICAPANWLRYIVYQLTLDIAPKFGIPLQERLYWQSRAESAFNALDDFETNTSFNICPRFQ